MFFQQFNARSILFVHSKTLMDEIFAFISQRLVFTHNFILLIATFTNLKTIWIQLFQVVNNDCIVLCNVFIKRIVRMERHVSWIQNVEIKQHVQ